MKVRKLLALVLTLLLVFAYGAFAAEGEAQEPGQQTAAQPAQQEAAATQAFERSLDVKGLFIWRWNYTQGTSNFNGSVTLESQTWQATAAAFTYKVTQQLRLNFTLYNALRWGDGAADGRSATNAFVPSSGDFPDSYSAFYGSTTGTKASATNTVTINTKNLIRLEQISMTWAPGGFFNEITVGRIINPWGFNSGLMLGARSGVDRFIWIGKTKMFGYMALPLFLMELRSDKDTKFLGDERLILQPGIVLVGPGKFIELLGITVCIDGLRKSASSTDKRTADLASYFLAAISMKMRSGSFMTINLELLGIMGRVDANSSATSIMLLGGGTGHNRIDMFKVFLNADFNLGFVTITPEFAFVTAPNRGYSTAGGNKYSIEHTGSNIGFATAYYQVGGMIMNSPSSFLGTGWYSGLFSAALKANFKLLGGTLQPWIKFAWATTVSKFVFETGNSVAVDGVNYLYATAGGFSKGERTKSLGFEIDLGINVTLTDSLVLGLEFGFYLPSSPIKNATKYSEYAGAKRVIAINAKLDFRF